MRKLQRALRGLQIVLSPETSIRIQVVIGVVVLVLGLYLDIRREEFLVLLLVVFSVIVLEGINTILERIIDLVEPRYKEFVREIKDGLAGIVLISALGALGVGLVIFWPYIKQFIRVLS